MRVCKAPRHVLNVCWLLQDFKTVLRGHGGTKDPLTLRTLVMILRHKDLPHGRFKATVKGISDITYPDRKVRSPLPWRDKFTSRHGSRSITKALMPPDASNMPHQCSQLSC